MSKKDFNLIAAALNRAYRAGKTKDSIQAARIADGRLDLAISCLANDLAQEYPAFNQDRFEAACRKTD